MVEQKKLSPFEVLNQVDCTDKIEQKNGLSYLSWAWAWGELKKRFPRSRYTIYEAEGGMIFFTDGNTCWVKTGVTIDGLEHIEYLPVMDFRNASITVDKVTSFDVNKAIQRSLTKAVARHGLGLYIYAGEDLPEGENTDDKLGEATNDIEAAKDVEELKEVYFKYEKDLKNDKRFVNAVNARKAKLEKVA